MKRSSPKTISPYAGACLEVLQKTGFGRYIVLGGAFGLAHYYEYRTTKDVDAWWTSDARETDKNKIIELLDTTLAKFGEVTLRRFGDVVSVDLHISGNIVFNFQIAARSALLRDPEKSAWPPIELDSLDDLIASKMTALIERGAPRDFLDIYMLCDKKIVTILNCWQLWKEREIKRGRAFPDPRVGCEGLLLHLSRIERMRPLAGICDPQKRKQAEALRKWFKYEFCKEKT